MHQKDIGYFIKNINDKLKTRADADLRRYNLTLTQSHVLIFLNSNGGSATQKEIELHLEVSHPTVVGVVSRMEQKGHVMCSIDKKDKRNKIVRLTKAARSIVAKIEDNIQTNKQRMFKSLSDDDIAAFRRILTVIYKNLE